MRKTILLIFALAAVFAAGCGGGSSESKMAKIAVWEDQGWTANGELTKMINDGDEGVRRRAALALARVNDTLTIDAVATRMLEDDDPAVRAALAFDFGVGRWQKRMGDLYELLERDNDPMAKREALQAIGRVYAREDYQRLFPFLHDSDPGVRAQTLITFDLINRRDEVDSLLPLLDDPDQQVQWSALFALLQARSEKAAQKAMRFTRDPSVEMRRMGYRVVGSSPDPAMKDSLMLGLKDPNPLVRAAAAEAFGLQVDTIAILDVLPYFDTETDPLVLMSLCRAVAEHWRIASAPYLKKLIRDNPDPGVRATAVKAAIRRLDFDFIDVIKPAASDPSDVVRFAFLEALEDASRYAQLDPAPFIDLIMELTHDPVPRVRARAVQTYAMYRGPEIPALVNRLFNDSDNYCFHSALGLIGGLRFATYQDSIYARYPDYTDMWRPEIKWGFIAATANMAGSVQANDQQRALFNWGLNDPNRLVRWYAIAVWEKFREDHRAELGTYKTDLTPENVQELLHPYTTNPTARLMTTKGPITIELWADKAPRTTRRFIQLAQSGVYDNCPMNDVQPGAIVQTGDRRGDGWSLPGESVRDEIQPDRVEAGTLLWLINTRDSGHGAFGIALAKAPYLDWRYGTFAKVTDGLDVAQRLTFSDSLKTVEIVTPSM